MGWEGGPPAIHLSGVNVDMDFMRVVSVACGDNSHFLRRYSQQRYVLYNANARQHGSTGTTRTSLPIGSDDVVPLTGPECMGILLGSGLDSKVVGHGHSEVIGMTQEL